MFLNANAIQFRPFLGDKKIQNFSIFQKKNISHRVPPMQMVNFRVFKKNLPQKAATPRS